MFLTTTRANLLTDKKSSVVKKNFRKIRRFVRRIVEGLGAQAAQVVVVTAYVCANVSAGERRII